MKIETIESGVFIDDVKLQDLGIEVHLDSDESLFPEVRTSSITIPGKHGAYKFGSDLEPLDFELKCWFDRSGSYTELAHRTRDFKKLFIDTYGRPKRIKLRFESEPDKFYYVEYSGKVPLEKLAHFGVFSLPLKAYDPHAYSIVESTKGVKWGDRIPWMSQIPISLGRTSYTISSPQTLSINNYGSLVVRPVIEISGSATSLTLTIKGESFSMGTFTNSTILIDAERYAAIKNGQNFLFQLQGNLEKLELMPGANAIQIGGSNLNINIAFKYRAKYI